MNSPAHYPIVFVLCQFIQINFLYTRAGSSVQLTLIMLQLKRRDDFGAQIKIEILSEYGIDFCY